MTRFRPCIDLHDGRVKQIVGSTLAEGAPVRENFVSEHPPGWFARRYAEDGLCGGHVIMLGAGNVAAAKAALEAYPGGLQVGGGIRVENAAQWLEAGASHVIVTSSVFDSDGRFSPERLEALVREVGRERLVLDLSCKATGEGWRVAMNRWQTLTDLAVDEVTLDALAVSCAEFLVHAVDVEGKCEGIDQELARFLGGWGKLPLTYAGGISSLRDLWDIQDLSRGRMDATVGSALDMFGGRGVRYEDCLRFNASSNEKAQLRCAMRDALRRLEANTVVRSERLLAGLCRDERWVPSGGGAVALFGGLRGEPDLEPLIPWLVARDVAVVYFRVVEGEMEARRVAAAEDLVRGPFGVLEPGLHCAPWADQAVDVVLTPGLAFDSGDGARLGRGKGYYDRFFSRNPNARRIGLAWQEQMLPRVPAEAHDVTMHALVSDAGWVLRQ